MAVGGYPYSEGLLLPEGVSGSLWSKSDGGAGDKGGAGGEGGRGE